MPDREKVIKGLEHCSSSDGCKGCPYSKNERGHVCSSDCILDALALLKEQPEIVRCKDCKDYRAGIDIDGKPFARCNGSVRTYGHTKPDWFCANGERRQEE